MVITRKLFRQLLLIPQYVNNVELAVLHVLLFRIVQIVRVLTFCFKENVSWIVLKDTSKMVLPAPFVIENVLTARDLPQLA